MTADKAAIYILSAIVVLGFGGIVLLWGYRPPKADSNILALLTGALTAAYGTVIGYWFTRKEPPNGS
jgi:VIT1/CCC1 family predicted Fe2+/Mn2+ transporter